MKHKTYKPHTAVLAVTYNCNSRCQMCNIWKKKFKKEIEPDVFLRLPKSLDDINISGGEPFLRNDLIKIIDNVFLASNPSKLVISTNGFLSKKIISFAKEILKKKYADRITIAISLDGIGDIHTKVRGIPNAFKLVEDTIKGLKKENFKNIGVGYTFIKGNEDEYSKVFDYAEKNGLNFGATIAHNADNYFSIENNQKVNADKVKAQTDYFINKKIKSFKKNELGKSYYMHGIAHYAKTGKALVECDAMRGSFFMDPFANIFPCNILSVSAGNLKEESFSEIWNNATSKIIRCKTKNCKTPCWMVCTAKPGIKKHWFKTGIWILKEKWNHLKTKK